jgi:hypothetical protein
MEVLHPQPAHNLATSSGADEKEKNNPYIHSFRRRAASGALVFTGLSWPPQGADQKGNASHRIRSVPFVKFL